MSELHGLLREALALGGGRVRVVVHEDGAEAMAGGTWEYGRDYVDALRTLAHRLRTRQRAA